MDGPLTDDARTLNGADIANNLGDIQGNIVKPYTFALQRAIFLEIKDAEAGQYIVHAPFLGAPAYDKGLPPELYIGEYMEFFRAYRTGFAHFLRTGAGKNERESQELFGKLMVAMAKANLTYDDQRSFEELIQDIYDVPMSSAEPDAKTDLEGRFIKWLDKQ